MSAAVRRACLVGLLAAMPAVASAQIRIVRGPGAGPEAILEESPAGFGVEVWRVGQWARYSISENVGTQVPLGRYRTIAVAAGTFHAVHWRRGSDELWASGEASPVGVVRYRTSDVEIELVARSDTGARSRLPFGGTP